MKYLREITMLVGHAGYDAMAAQLYPEHCNPVTRRRWAIADLRAAGAFRRWALEDGGGVDMDPKL